MTRAEKAVQLLTRIRLEKPELWREIQKFARGSNGEDALVSEQALREMLRDGIHSGAGRNRAFRQVN